MGAATRRVEREPGQQSNVSLNGHDHNKQLTSFLVFHGDTNFRSSTIYGSWNSRRTKQARQHLHRIIDHVELGHDILVGSDPGK